MNRIQELFSTKKDSILNIYFTAGYPTLNSTVPIIQSLSEAGVDIIEIGIPYSDPLADGPTIQDSGSKALQNGMTLEILFHQVKEARQHTQIPFILMGYFNQMMQYGIDAFLQKAKESGVDGLIIPDLPMEVYETEYQSKFESQDIGITFLVTPQSGPERIQKAAELSKNSFLYVISKASITGATGNITDQQKLYFDQVNGLKGGTPSLIGFGIHDHATFRTACESSNGAIIGSAFIRYLGGEGESTKLVQGFVDGVRKG